jgi:hypothetical protein
MRIITLTVTILALVLAGCAGTRSHQDMGGGEGEGMGGTGIDYNNAAPAFNGTDNSELPDAREMLSDPGAF